VLVFICESGRQCRRTLTQLAQETYQPLQSLIPTTIWLPLSTQCFPITPCCPSSPSPGAFQCCTTILPPIIILQKLICHTPPLAPYDQRSRGGKEVSIPSECLLPISNLVNHLLPWCPWRPDRKFCKTQTSFPNLGGIPLVEVDLEIFRVHDQPIEWMIEPSSISPRPLDSVSTAGNLYEASLYLVFIKSGKSAAV
jgi:hypothetical protein